MVIVLNRPEAGNSLDPDTGRGLLAALDRAASDDVVRTVVMTGAGSKVFCAGMDLKAFAAGLDMSDVAGAITALERCTKPVIGAINGTAVAGGFELAMRCDLVVATEHALFGLPEVKRSLVAAGGGTRLPSRIPLAVALEIGLTGDTFDAARALSLGLINKVVPASAVVDEAIALAERINANGPLAVRITKQLMYDELGAGDATHVAKVSAPVFRSEDAREGARAFAEKRTPVWKGR
ncbi:enoyl-CoA hydratase-related protein [Mycolicibacterium sp.]|uniref:enoyl-CoA hydratase-related protein n=1 Tax=Mycolicibacterium sp. TaxID=2320850 RepID=UPI003D0F577E